MRGTLVGRDAPLELAFEALVRDGRVLVEGPAGIGKTALLSALADLAGQRGMVILRCSPTENEAALPLAALADLIGPVSAEIDHLPSAQRRAARCALLLDGEPEPVDERALAAAVRTVLDAAAADNAAGLLVVIDDAPWLDPPSERALEFALRRCSSQVRVVIARRTGDGVDPVVPLGLDARGQLERMTLRPLEVGPLHRLLTQRFGVSLSRSVVARVARESGGNPLLAVELTRAVLRLPHLPGPGDDLPVPVSVTELVQGSLATLRDETLRAVRLAALLSTPSLVELEAAGVTAEAFDLAEEVGLVTVDDGAVRFVHPVYASAVRSGIPAGVRRRLHALLAGSSVDPDERARHLAKCTTGRDGQVASDLGDAAERARGRGAPDLAADLYARAIDFADDDTAAATFRLRALHCLFDCGSYEQAAEQADAMADDLGGDFRAEALLLRAAVAFAGDDIPHATATAQRALAAATPSSRLAGRIHAHLAMFVDGATVGREHAAAALALLGERAEPSEIADVDVSGSGTLGHTDRGLLASVLMLLFLSEVRSGLTPAVEMFEQALVMEGEHPSRLAGTVPAIWWKGIDEHQRARDRLHSMLDAATAAGDEPHQHELMQHLVEAETLAGNYERAAGWVVAARELAGQLGAGVASERYLGGMLDVLRGDLAEARVAGEAGLAEAAASDDPWLRRVSLQLSGFAALADGRAADAASAYAELAAELDLTGLVEPLGSRGEADWLEACVSIGDLTTAGVALDRLVRRHDRLPRPWTTLALARSRVLIASATGQDTTTLVEELMAAVDSTPEDVVPFDRARCLLVAGLAHRRARRKRAARTTLLAAAAQFDSIGAPGFASRARAEAARTGTRTAVSEELTSSESRVAELAAAGATNREIADALFISPKTVEANLARAYRKLGIARRVELPAALGARVQTSA